MAKGRGPRRGGAWYKQATGFKTFVLERDHHACQICGCKVGEVCNWHYAPVSQMDVAHIVPWKVNHDSTLTNVRAVCHPCNCRERDRTERQPVFV